MHNLNCTGSASECSGTFVPLELLLNEELDHSVPSLPWWMRRSLQGENLGNEHERVLLIMSNDNSTDRHRI
jgi:hypothetical protein